MDVPNTDIPVLILGTRDSGLQGIIDEVNLKTRNPLSPQGANLRADYIENLHSLLELPLEKKCAAVISWPAFSQKTDSDEVANWISRERWALPNRALCILRRDVEGHELPTNILEKATLIYGPNSVADPIQAGRVGRSIRKWLQASFGPRSEAPTLDLPVDPRLRFLRAITKWLDQSKGPELSKDLISFRSQFLIGLKAIIDDVVLEQIEKPYSDHDRFISAAKTIHRVPIRSTMDQAFVANCLVHETHGLLSGDGLRTKYVKMASAANEVYTSLKVGVLAAIGVSLFDQLLRSESNPIHDPVCEINANESWATLIFHGFREGFKKISQDDHANYIQDFLDASEIKAGFSIDQTRFSIIIPVIG